MGAATNMTARQSMGAGSNTAACQSTGAAKSTTNMAAAEMATTHSATKVTTAAKVTTATEVATATAAVSASTATASEGLRLYRAHSQSDHRNDDSNLAQHHILHLGRSRVLVSGYCRHSPPSGTLRPAREFR
jgi:hypothetical protein